MIKIKLCGMTRELDIQYANRVSADYVGFVFAPSKRKISNEIAINLRQLLNKEIVAVGVFVDANLYEIQELVASGTIQMVQLHGKETNNYIEELRGLVKCPIIKAFSVESKEDIAMANNTIADYVLFDSGKGGSGESFCWSLINEVNKPFFLAGGLCIENVTDAILQTNPFAVDVSSGIETDYSKDEKKIIEFVRRVSYAKR